MGGLIPLGDASRRPVRVPVVTILIILVNAFVFVLELTRGEAFVTQWAAVPSEILSGHRWITIRNVKIDETCAAPDHRLHHSGERST